MVLMLTVDGWHYEDMEGMAHAAAENLFLCYFFFSFMYLYLRDCCFVSFLLGVHGTARQKYWNCISWFSCINWTILICDVTSLYSWNHPYLENSCGMSPACDTCH